MCEITSGYSAKCDTQGGVGTWYWYATKDDQGLSNVETVTELDGNITALTLKAGKYAYPLNVEMETSTFNDTSIGERANKAYAREQDATIIMHGNTAEMIVNIENAAKGRVTLIAVLNDGTAEILFLENGGKCSDVRTPGQAYEDMNGNTLTITGKEKMKARKISLTIVEALLEPVS